MHTIVRVQITCTLAELRNYTPFARAAEFAMYDSDIDIICMDTKQTKMYNCSATLAGCYGWAYFKDEWERKFGKVNA